MVLESVEFLYYNYKAADRVMKSIPFTSAQNPIKYMGIKLTIEVKKKQPVFWKLKYNEKSNWRWHTKKKWGKTLNAHEMEEKILLMNFFQVYFQAAFSKSSLGLLRMWE